MLQFIHFQLGEKNRPIEMIIIQYAAAAAKSLQSCPTLWDPIDGSPPGSSVPGILQARTLEWVTISFSNAWMHAKLLQSCPTLRPYGLQPTRLLCPQDSPGKNPGVSCHLLLQTQYEVCLLKNHILGVMRISKKGSWKRGDLSWFLKK